jgi:hypothetical protein
MVRTTVFGFGLASALAGCTPNFSDTTTLVSGPRLLAARTTPAEGPPGTAFTLDALYDSDTGVADAGSLEWASCLLQKPLGDPGSVNPACFLDHGAGLVNLGAGDVVRGVVPANACELFGPESPPALPGQPSPRPTDPDSTGGYYLPIRVVSASNDKSVAFERIACQPSGVVESVFSAFSTGYVLNENPVVSALARVLDAATPLPILPVDGGSQSATTIAPGTSVTFRAEWPSCPAKPAACGGAETYLLIDVATGNLTTARESMVASWYSSAGSFAFDQVGREGTDETSYVDNTWTAPTATGVVRVWVVLRDARGGVGWQSYALDVEP